MKVVDVLWPGALLSLMCAVTAKPAPAAEPVVPEKRAVDTAGTRPVVDERWEALFTRSAEWNGGDVAGSVDLGDGRMLWLFGDSFFGNVREGKRQPGTAVVNNSAAIHPWPAAAAATAAHDGPPSRETWQFFAGPKNAEGKITALFPPTTAADAATNQELAPLEEYWPTGGGYVVKAADGKRRLYVGLFRIRKTKRDQGVWGFRRVGNSLGIVEDVAAPVERWKMRVVAVPHAVGDHEASARRASVSWGEAFLKHGAGRQEELLIYGVRTRTGGKRELIAARVPLAGAEQFDHWEFAAGKGGWTKQVDEAAALFEDIAPEFSVEPLKYGKFDGYVMVHNEPLLGAGILARTAEGPLGPWSPPRVVYRPALPAGDKDLFSYAAKGHAALSPPGELLVSYIVSAHDFWRLFREAGLYRPRFVRVPLQAVIPE